MNNLHIQGESGGTHLTPGEYCTGENNLKKLMFLYDSHFFSNHSVIKLNCEVSTTT